MHTHVHTRTHLPARLPQVVTVAAGKHHMLALTTAGEVWSFGNNRDGKLGYVSPDTQPTPRKCVVKEPTLGGAEKQSWSIVMYIGGLEGLGQVGRSSSF